MSTQLAALVAGSGDTSRRVGLLSVLGLIGWMFGASARVAADDHVVFQASVDRTRVTLDRTLRLTISVSVPEKRKLEHLELPDTGSLEVIGTSREESMSFSFSGGASQYRKFTNTVLTLQPTKAGVATIGPARLKFAGRIYRTKPIQVRVVARRGGSSGPTSPLPRRRSPFGFLDDDWFRTPWDDLLRRPEPVGEGDIFIRAYISPDLVVEGQQVSMSVIIYSRVGARIAEVRWPKLDGFYAVERDVSKAPTEEKYIDGLRYQYKLLGRRALFPLQPGDFTLGPVKVVIEAHRSPFFPGDSRTLRSRPLRIKVEPLPAQGVPEGFHRANVGRYTLTAQVDSNEVGLNQPVTYTLKVRGTGNIQGIRPPELPPVDRFKVFDPTVDVQLAKRSAKVKGSKIVEYLLLPRSSGKLTIPSVAFSFYDPEAGQYQTVRTRAEVIEVLAGADRGVAGAAQRAPGVNIVAGAFKPIRFQSALHHVGPPFYKRPAFVPMIVVPPVAYLLVLLVGLFRGMLQTDSPRSRNRKAWSEARRHWKLAGRAAVAGQTATFYAELKEALMQAVESRTGNAPHGVRLPDLQRQLVTKGVPPELIDDLVREVENCDFGRFAPATSQGPEMSGAQQRVGRLMKGLQKECVASTTGGSRR